MSGQGQNRTADTAVFSRVLCQLSYLAARSRSHLFAKPRANRAERLAVPTGFEPAISALTGRRVKPDYTTGPYAVFVPPAEFESALPA